MENPCGQDYYLVVFSPTNNTKVVLLLKLEKQRHVLIDQTLGEVFASGW